MKLSSLACLASLGVALFAACGNSSTSASSTSGSSSSGGPCNAGLATADGSDFCKAEAVTPNCQTLQKVDKNLVCGVPLPNPPTDELKRSSNVKEYAGSGAPDLACFQAASYPKKPDPATQKKTVKVQGVAKIFSNGCMSNDLQIEFYKVVRDGSSNDGNLGDKVGSTVKTIADCTMTGTSIAHMGCNNDTRFECPYEYDGVPEETDLVIKTFGATWAPLYDYNIYVPDAEVTGGVWKHDVRALDASDYTLIPQVSPLGHPIAKGNGAIAGEVHDCGDVRLSHAVVDVSSERGVLTYFTSDEEKPLPDPNASSTSILGLYAALDVAPGAVAVGGVGRLNGKLEAVGYYRAWIFPDSVTAVTFRGVRPWQVP